MSSDSPSNPTQPAHEGDTRPRGPHAGTITPLLVVLSLVGLTLTWWTLLEGPRRAQNRSIALIDDWDGRVESVSSCPEWLRLRVEATFVEEYFRWVVKVDLRIDGPVAGRNVDVLSSFRELEELVVRGPESIVDLAPVLGRLPPNRDLVRLQVANSNALPRASSVPSLTMLFVLNWTDDEGEGDFDGEIYGGRLADLDSVKTLHVLAEKRWARSLVPYVARMNSLRTLTFTLNSAERVSSAELTSLARLPKLESLVLGGMPLTHDRTAALAEFPELRRLSLYRMDNGNGYGDAIDRVHVDALRELARIGRLEELSLRWHPVNDEALAAFEGHPSLSTLDIDGTLVTHRSIPTLLSMNELRTLNVRGIELTPDQRRALEAGILVVTVDDRR